ncbi:MAG TPA: hypothetical protein VF529_19910 [Solirubrobacteraceae bacterium]|jgi:hypothetical protein
MTSSRTIGVTHGWLVSSPARLTDPRTGHEVDGFVWTLVLTPRDLPAPPLARLPFEDQTYSAWTDTTDVFSFAEALFSFRHLVVGFDGRQAEVDAPYVGESFIPAQRQRIERCLEEFRASAEDFDPYEDARLGGALKHDVGWRALESLVLQEARYFSLPHLLEATRDLDCSLLLAARGFYKQSLQVLRGFLEAAVMPLHFSRDPGAFSRWQRGRYRTPALRGRQGILRELTNEGLIDDALADQAAAAYGTLSAAVHGAEAELEHAGVFRGERPIPGVSAQKLARWSRVFGLVVEAGTRLLAAVSNDRPPSTRSQLFCNSCHNGDEKRFAVSALQFGDALYDRVRCEICGATRVQPLHFARELDAMPWEFPGVHFTRERSL